MNRRVVLVVLLVLVPDWVVCLRARGRVCSWSQCMRAMCAQAIRAGATEVAPVADAYGWRLGRIVDPFGHHWEIGKPLS